MPRKPNDFRVLEAALKGARRPWKFRKARQHFERVYVDYVLARCGSDRKRAARALGISLSSLKEKLRRGFGGRR
jgi:DNA-binding NtrC family response regulator